MPFEKRTFFLLAAFVSCGCVRGFNEKSAPHVAGVSNLVTRPSSTVLLADSKTFFCSGTLIAPQVVVTASHCIFVGAPERNARQSGGPLPVKSGMRVLFTRNMSEVVSAPQRRVVDQKSHANSIFLNPQHSPIDASSGGSFDIALLKLDQPAPADVPVARISSLRVELLKGKALNLQGFGSTEVDRADSGVLREGELTYYLREIPGEFYAQAIAETGTSPCPGDSGGSLYFFATPTEVPTLVGVSSRILLEAGKCSGSKSIFVDVAYFRSWLLKTAESMGLSIDYR